MTVISTHKDPEHLSLTLVAEFASTPERVWAVWEDPRKLEQWWGPPGWPATFTRHDFVVDGESRYHLTGPAGEKHWGFWRMHVIDKPVRIDFANGLAGADGEPIPEMAPMAGAVTFEETGDGTRMTTVTQFVDLARMEEMISMGIAEGMAQAIGQVDALLASTTV
ncbi:MAG TPA: SRPBCC domain-containing protein [Acidimicrobiales bacterium]|nr:SRPBCC domain-containing protein [Acidimicrobiales bacterium]